MLEEGSEAWRKFEDEAKHGYKRTSWQSASRFSPFGLGLSPSTATYIRRSRSCASLIRYDFYLVAVRGLKKLYEGTACRICLTSFTRLRIAVAKIPSIKPPRHLLIAGTTPQYAIEGGNYKTTACQFHFLSSSLQCLTSSNHLHGYYSKPRVSFQEAIRSRRMQLSIPILFLTLITSSLSAPSNPNGTDTQLLGRDTADNGHCRYNVNSDGPRDPGYCGYCGSFNGYNAAVRSRSFSSFAFSTVVK